MAENLFCSRCGAQNLGVAQFCQKCGGALLQVPAQPLQSPLQPAPQVQPVAYAPPPATYVPASPYAGFWIRFLAYFIDTVLIDLVAVPLFLLFMLPSLSRIIEEAEGNGEPSPELIMSFIASCWVFGLVTAVGVWLYDALLTSSAWQGTIGKRVLRLKVVDENGNRIGFGRATGRYFSKILSGFLLVGYIMAAFTDRKRALHDMIAGTLVMKY